MDETTTSPVPDVPASQDHQGPSIRWDDLTIEREKLHLPEELREDYRWLKAYVREAHHRDLDSLFETAQRLGLNHDKTTWAKILRGRWNRSPKGDVLPSPVISQEKLGRAIAQLRQAASNEASRGKVPFVMTTVSQSIFDWIDMKRGLNRVNRFGIVVGPTGSSKTATFREYERQRNHGLTSWFEAPASGLLTEFITRLGTCMGIAAKTGMGQKRAHILRGTSESKVIIVDNAQDLYRPGRDLAAFTFLRQLQDETNCVVILSITPTFERELVQGMLSSYWEQFVGRSGGTRKWLRLPANPPEEDVLMIAEAFGFRDAKKHLKQLVAITREQGRIRILFDDLQDAKRLASIRKEALTIDHLVEVRGED